MSKATVLVCRCANTKFVPQADVDGLIRRLQQAGCEVTAVDDLCALVARRDPLLQQFAGRNGQTAPAGSTIVACFPRGVRALFVAADAELPENISIHNLRTQTADEILAAVSTIPVGAMDVAQSEIRPSASLPSTSLRAGNPKSEVPGGWLPWFPAIDYSRCRHCRQCANFCLFGVYSIDDGKVKVARPASCKPLCPACARLCPHAAIIFPKYGSAPINGDAVTPENIGREHVGEELLKSPQATGDLIEMLRKRAKGFHRAESGQQAGPASAELPQSEIRPSTSLRAGNPKSEMAMPLDAQRILESARNRAEETSTPPGSSPQHKA